MHLKTLLHLTKPYHLSKEELLALPHDTPLNLVGAWYKLMLYTSFDALECTGLKVKVSGVRIYSKRDKTSGVEVLDEERGWFRLEGSGIILAFNYENLTRTFAFIPRIS